MYMLSHTHRDSGGKPKPKVFENTFGRALFEIYCRKAFGLGI
jgi:hypothetical protein